MRTQKRRHRKRRGGAYLHKPTKKTYDEYVDVPPLREPVPQPQAMQQVENAMAQMDNAQLRRLLAQIEAEIALRVEEIEAQRR